MKGGGGRGGIKCLSLCAGGADGSGTARKAAMADSSVLGRAATERFVFASEFEGSDKEVETWDAWEGEGKRTIARPRDLPEVGCAAMVTSAGLIDGWCLERRASISASEDHHERPESVSTDMAQGWVVREMGRHTKRALRWLYHDSD